ncbi:MAG: hypothetical protein OEW29_01920 [Acidimicrobiia bacterium]|nr:hypothetical protein [Acidimicrobiia bacterium]MDH4366230.1 hypothetical protein [Acidimicrobiia bacterium]
MAEGDLDHPVLQRTVSVRASIGVALGDGTSDRGAAADESVDTGASPAALVGRVT